MRFRNVLFPYVYRFGSRCSTGSSTTGIGGRR